MKQFSLILVCLFFGFSTSSAQSLEQRLDTYFNSFTEGSLHGMVSVSQKGAPVYQKYFGFADIEAEKRPDTLTKYKIGSASKMYTATMIFQLIDEKKLTLETPLSTFFDGFQDADSISIDRMLKHRSGLYDIVSDSNIKEWKSTEKSREEMLELIKSHDNSFTPGSKKRYSHTNYILLSMILENITKKTYPDLLKERIVDKAGLKMTQYGDSLTTESTLAKGYNLVSDSYKVAEETHVSSTIGAGAIVSTPEDMNVFMHELFDGKLLTTSSLGQLTYESGMNSMNFQSRIVHGHEGSIDGFNSYSGYYPKDDLAFAYTFNAMNAKEFSVENFIKALLNIKVRKVIEVEPKKLASFAGIYNMDGYNVTIAFKEDKLYMSTDNGMPELELTPMTSTEFFNKSFNIEAEFDSDKVPSTFTIKIFSQKPMTGTKQ